MKKLTVTLAYRITNDAQRHGELSRKGLLLPVKVLDTESATLAEGVTSADSITFDLPDTTNFVFVRLIWPSGRSETQRVDFENASQVEVSFDDSRFSSNEWAAWAIPRLNPRTNLAVHGDIDLGLNRFEKVWLRLWKFTDGNWSREELSPKATYRNNAAWQLDLSLDESLPWLLQIGGSKVVWRFVSLPGGGSVRVFITPQDSTDPRADALKIVVTSFRTDAETLLEFLARDAIKATSTLANSATLAEQLFADKFSDPVSAIAGAYYLLRVGDWRSIPIHWFENLFNQFSWLPDTTIIYCVRLLREGNTTRFAHQSNPRDLFEQCLENGWPIYSEGISLLQEAAAVLHDEFKGDQALLDSIRAIGSAKAWAGAATSFYGRSPDVPSSVQWVGMPHAPRQHRRPEISRNERKSKARKFIELASLKSLPKRDAAPKIKIAQRSEDEEFLLGDIKRRLIESIDAS